MLKAVGLKACPGYSCWVIRDWWQKEYYTAKNTMGFHLECWFLLPYKTAAVNTVASHSIVVYSYLRLISMFIYLCMCLFRRLHNWDNMRVAFVGVREYKKSFKMLLDHTFKEMKCCWNTSFVCLKWNVSKNEKCCLKLTRIDWADFISSLWEQKFHLLCFVYTIFS
jgi:hypothetical protein